MFVAAAFERIQAAQVLTARQRQARGESLRSAGGVHGFAPALTSFVGRAGPVSDVAALLDLNRLVTVTGPGGAGRTRLAGEVARQVAGRFADGAWLAELSAVRDPVQVPAAVAAALGMPEQPGVTAADALARALARRQLLLVLDNCEHVIGAAAQLCAGLLTACDDMRVLATSREPLAVGGETRYRLAPLTLPACDRTGDCERSEAVMLFADRAFQVDPHFALTGGTGPLVGRLVTRLDGMPLAIELAAARVEALGVAQLLDRIDDRFALLADGDRVAPDRHRSLAAALIDAGDLAAAERSCAAGLRRSRDAGDLGTLVRLLIRMAALDRRAGRITEAAAHTSHLDRIRDKTGCRRRADLTRLALTTGLV